MLGILLPNWEIKQAVFPIAADNVFAMRGEQEWELQEFQNCTYSDIFVSGMTAHVPFLNFIFYLWKATDSIQCVPVH